MLTAGEISSAIERATSQGRALAIVSLMAREGRAAESAARLLIAEGGAIAGGTLGDSMLDEAAARYAVTVLTDDRKEIVVAGFGELAAAGEVDPSLARERFGDVRVLVEISRPPLELVICGGGH